MACQATMQEVFKLKRKPDEETVLALALILWNVSLNAVSFGKLNIFFVNPKDKKMSTQFNLVKFFLKNYNELQNMHQAEEKKLTVN